jgi:hypothetical protein
MGQEDRGRRGGGGGDWEAMTRHTLDLQGKRDGEGGGGVPGSAQAVAALVSSSSGGGGIAVGSHLVESGHISISRNKTPLTHSSNQSAY